jgi:REP element-mobilizing transposase RayT
MLEPDAEWDDNDRPLAYLITFRTYGTWLHGDERRSVDTHDHKNVYGLPNREPSPILEGRMKEKMRQAKIVLDRKQREIVKDALEGECRYRNYKLHAINVRSNHVHIIVSADLKPEIIADRLKACATRRLRGSGQINKDEKVWSRGRSRQYLWKEIDLSRAIAYVVYDQGDSPSEIRRLA